MAMSTSLDRDGALPAGTTDAVQRRNSNYSLSDGMPNGEISMTRNEIRLLVLTSPRSGAIIGTLDILVDIGVPAEKEVIQ
jgi:hypothetical protein